MTETLKTTTNIDTLQRWVLVASWIYYEANDSIVEDSFYDRTARRLVELQKNYKGDIKDTQYGYVFYDFDGTTGFDLYHRLKDSDKIRITDIGALVVKNMRADRARKSKKGK